MKIPFRFVRRDNFEMLRAENFQLKQILNSSVLFIQQIEKGNYDEIPVAENLTHEVLLALQRLQVSLTEIGKKETERKWVADGLATFMDILRTDTDNLVKLADKIISALVKYLNANQGAIFIVNDPDSVSTHLQMLSCYAYGRKKFSEKKINLGEGIIGQVYLEKASVYLTDIPNGYTTITSGLGEATPKSLLIVPLKIDGRVLAIVELASFHAFFPYQLRFLEELGESIASVISTLNINSRTEKLLKASQIQTEELKAQEEEMRQNLEELTAMQESQRRLQIELNMRLQDLETAKLKIEEMKKAEAEKMKKQNDVQTRIMNSTIEKFKKREAELLQQLNSKEQQLATYLQHIPITNPN